MTTQQPRPQTEPQLYDIALHIGRLEGLLEAVIEEQRAHRAETNARFGEVNARIDALERKVDHHLYITLGVVVSVGLAILGGQAVL